MKIQKNNKHLYNIPLISLILGFLIIIFVLWNRLIRVRLSHTIPKILENTEYIYIVIFNIIICTIIIIYNIKNLIIVKKEPSKINKYLYEMFTTIKILDILIIINKHVLQSPKVLYEFIFQKVNVSHLLEKPFHRLSDFIERSPEKKENLYLTLIYICFIFLLKFIVANFFINDLLFHKELNYFYRSLFLLLIPLIYNALLWILTDLCDKNTYYATAHITVKITKDNQYLAKFREKVPPIEDAIDFIAHNRNKDLLQWFMYMYTTYRDIKWLVYQLEEIRKKYGPYEIIIISLLYLIGWSYIIYVNIKGLT